MIAEELVTQEHMRRLAAMEGAKRPQGHHITCVHCKVPALRCGRVGETWRLLTLSDDVHGCPEARCGRNDPKMQAKAAALMEKGYRRVSRAGCRVARVDREDWQVHMAHLHAPWDIREGVRWVTALGKGAADFYRRVHSKDCIAVPRDISENVAPSQHDAIGYVHAEVAKEAAK